MRTTFLLPFLFVFASCASHNAHRVELVPSYDLDPLAREAIDGLEDDYGQPLPTAAVAFATDVEALDLQWLLADEDAGTSAPATDEELRLVLEDAIAAELGAALVAAEDVDASDLRIDSWLLVDLHELDEVGLQLCAVLTHKNRPERILAEGASEIVRLPRLRCFGCRDHWFREKGTNLRELGPRGWRRRGVGGGFWFWGGLGLWRGWGGGATYFKGRR